MSSDEVNPSSGEATPAQVDRGRARKARITYASLREGPAKGSVSVFPADAIEKLRELAARHGEVTGDDPVREALFANFEVRTIKRRLDEVQRMSWSL